jgi:hypothetical protein
MVVPPGNHRGSDLRRTCKCVARFETRGRPASGWAKRGGARGRGGYEAKRIRSHYLPWMTRVTSKLSTTTPPKGLASLSTINAATMRLCRAELPASAHSSRLESRSHSVPPHRAYSSE